VGNCAEVLPELLERGVMPDIVTDQTSAHDPVDGYVPCGFSIDEATVLRNRDRNEYRLRSMESIRRHCEAIVEMMRRGAVAVDYGNNLRGYAREAGFEDAFAYPGFVPAYVRPLFCEGKGPFRWVALSGDPADIHRTDDLVLEMFPGDEHLCRWIRMAREQVAFQGLPARICWLGQGDRARFGVAMNDLVSRGEISAPVVIGRDHLDTGSVASPYRETEDMVDGSDAIMLSGETAAGIYPVESVQTMANIAQEAERVRSVTQPHYRPSQQALDGFFGFSATGSEKGPDSHADDAPSVAEAVSQATVDTARNVGAAAIIAPTARGATAKKLARFRPSVPIIAVTPSHLVYRQLALYWGVFPLMGQRMNTIDEMLEDAVRIALRAGFVQQGDVTVVTGGVVGGVPGETNLMTVRRIARVLMHGQGVGNRRMSGRVVRLRPGQDPQAQEIQRRMMTTQDILVAEELNQVSMELVYHAGGLITAESAPDSIAALAAVELGIPAILQAAGEWDELVDGQTIVIDARTGNVYEWDL